MYHQLSDSSFDDRLADYMMSNFSDCFVIETFSLGVHDSFYVQSCLHRRSGGLKLVKRCPRSTDGTCNL